MQYSKELTFALCKFGLEKYNLGAHNPYLDLCVKNPEPFFYAQSGFEKGIQRCRDSFRCHRWNCTTHKEHKFKLFGVGMARASRESAIMIAMAVAGMVEHVTNELAKGKREKLKISLNDCINMRRPRNPKEYVSFDDCNADLTLGEYHAKKIIDTWIQDHDTSQKEIMMNEHNAAVGSLSVRSNMREICKCAGMSGACNAKYCYRILRNLDVSTQWLREKYEKAKKVQASHRPKRDGTRPLVTVQGHQTPAKDDLIYLLNSPNYCDYDTETGSLGTKGRLCNICSDSNDGLGSCEEMCCGRGYSKHEMIVTVHCQCTFNDTLISIECKKCKKKVTQYRCK